MANRINPGGNGSAGKGMIDTCPVGEGCTLFIPNPTHPPPAELLHVALTDVLRKFVLAHRSGRKMIRPRGDARIWESGPATPEPVGFYREPLLRCRMVASGAFARHQTCD